MAKSQLIVDTYTGKLSRLKEDALKLLGVSGLDTLDKLEPFGDSINDFIEFHIYDLVDNYLGSGKIISIPTDGKLDVGAHLRGLGYERGDYKIVYNFLRRLGGSWNSVLVKKSDKSIYASTLPRWIDTNGKIYVGETGDTEEELLLKDHKYFLQEISPSRTEVRLAVNPGINDSDYLEEFRLMGYTCLSFTDRVGTAKIDGTGKKVEILNSSKSLIQRMVGGKLVIRDALVIGQDITPQEVSNYKPFKEILPCVDGTQSQISGLIQFSNTETLTATLNPDDSGFIPKMRGGKIIIKNAIRLMDIPDAAFTISYTGAVPDVPVPVDTLLPRINALEQKLLGTVKDLRTAAYSGGKSQGVTFDGWYRDGTDLNKDAGGDWIYLEVLYHDTGLSVVADSNTEKINELDMLMAGTPERIKTEIVGSSLTEGSVGSGGWYRDGTDLNQGAGGSYIYLNWKKHLSLFEEYASADKLEEMVMLMEQKPLLDNIRAVAYSSSQPNGEMSDGWYRHSGDLNKGVGGSYIYFESKLIGSTYNERAVLEARFYEHQNYTGQYISIGPGSWNMTTGWFPGVNGSFNDRITSWKIPEGLNASMYEHYDNTGWRIDIGHGTMGWSSHFPAGTGGHFKRNEPDLTSDGGKGVSPYAPSMWANDVISRIDIFVDTTGVD